MARPKGSKNKTASVIAKDTIERLQKSAVKESDEVKQEIAEAIEELQDVVGSDDLLGGSDNTLEEIRPDEAPKADAPVVVSQDSHGVRRLVGRCPVTKAPVYR